MIGAFRQIRWRSVALLSWLSATNAMAEPFAMGGGADAALLEPFAQRPTFLTPGWSPEAMEVFRRWVTDGEAALAEGRVPDAAKAFEQAALMAHEANSELGLLRVQMQAGEYRQALAFAAHTAGVHLDKVGGAVFYAWLLYLGGQQTVAEQTLQRAESRHPDAAIVRLARARFREAVLRSDDGELMRPPTRLAPYATGEQADAGAKVVASAALLADGLHALVPRTALPPGTTRIWLRNGLGQTVSARMPVPENTTAGKPPTSSSDPPDMALVILDLSAPLPVAKGTLVPPRDAFAGSPVWAVTYPSDVSGAPAWPVMRGGFLGRTDLGVRLPSQEACGGPVFDQGGRLVGVVVREAPVDRTDGTRTSTDRLMPMGILRARWGERFGAASAESRVDMVGADHLYERAMRTSLQVLVAPVP